MKIVLASASPRRQELLTRVLEEFTVIISDFQEETVKFNGDFEDYVKEISKGKATDVASKLVGDSLVIGVDTIVAFEGKVLGKPKDNEEAYAMLKMLSGKVHTVYSGITLMKTLTSEILSTSVATKIKFSNLSDEEILNYVNTGDALDKAGAYGIQGLAGVFVEEIQGCYYNVVGLPINKLNSMLKNFL
ncbi:Maf-like protein [Clostridium hydrogeniformans]|uniref:Maf-like protein n=1 Tax=Clostridium hydrogeniformans TaxID=349933 RepID=UPI000485DA95|nr:Maf-like protein [Clostridium hydrogeniformans]